MSVWERDTYLCVEGKILAIAQYVIKYDYIEGIQKETEKSAHKKFLLLSTPFMAFY